MLTRTTKTRFEISDKRRITFYAAVFNVPTQIMERDARGKLTTYVEVIRPGAFSESLTSGDPVLANVDHDDDQAFSAYPGGGLVLQEDPHGLFATCWAEENPAADRMLERVKRGELDGCSFRFTPFLDRTEGDTVERIKVKLYDVCLTPNPAYPGTQVVHLRNDLVQRQLSARYRYAKIKSWRLHTGS